MLQTISSIRILFHNATKQTDALKAVQMIAQGLDETLGILEDSLKYLSSDIARKVEDGVERALRNKTDK